MMFNCVYLHPNINTGGSGLSFANCIKFNENRHYVLDLSLMWLITVNCQTVDVVWVTVPAEKSNYPIQT